jgi:hypothetical protein
MGHVSVDFTCRLWVEYCDSNKRFGTMHMSNQPNRVGVKLLGLIDGAAEGPWGISALVFIVLAVLVLWRF